MDVVLDCNYSTGGYQVYANTHCESQVRQNASKGHCLPFTQQENTKPLPSWLFLCIIELN